MHLDHLDLDPSKVRRGSATLRAVPSLRSLQGGCHQRDLRGTGRGAPPQLWSRLHRVHPLRHLVPGRQGGPPRRQDGAGPGPGGRGRWPCLFWAPCRTMSPGGKGSLPFSENTRVLFDTANAASVGNTEIGCEQLLLAFCEPPLAQSGAMVLLKGLGLSGEKLKAAVEEELSAPVDERQLAAVGADEKGDSDLTLDQVATDLTQMAMDGLLDPVVGRQEEMERIIQILLRKRKNNCCLVGPPGVGKTAVVEGLAQRIAQGEVPSRLRGKQLYSLDLGQLVAGTKYRGEFEDRLKKVINEVTSDERDICLFIDEIHQIIGAGAAGADSSMDAANLLKPSLARGELQVIGATTADEYTKHIEKDAALERRFQRVNCEDASVSETLEVLEGLRPSYEAHHGVLLSPDALQAATRLSQRYLTNRFLPDKAVDLIDEASSLAQWRMELQLEQANEEESPGEQFWTQK
ncbi:Chaperone protein ClpC3 [Durusdinium trenchii]|uniref:Chloroplastic (ATP-dependent Clp protease ATP-binding subunit ClpC homolog 3) (Casein lytic proteinase C3) n=1 Tax=Durusdinium trenchii TaxID=1381693 RepID=A0ABP0PJ89_9DINO